MREVPLASETIDSTFDLLVLIHPKDISQSPGRGSIPLGGGKVAFLDPLAIVDQTPNPNGNNMMGFSSSSNLIVFWLPGAWSSYVKVWPTASLLGKSFQRGATANAALFPLRG